MKRALFLCFFPVAVFAAADPFSRGDADQNDLETALARLLPRDRFFVHVETQVSTRSERKPMETELIETRLEGPSAPAARPEASPPVPMPGFSPEPEETEEAPPPVAPPTQTRHVYRIVETPVLDRVHVHVAFDEAIAADVLGKAKTLVSDYLSSGYNKKSSVVFSQVPMLKPKEEPAAPPAPAPAPVSPRQLAEEKDQLFGDERFWDFARWLNLALMVVTVAFLWRIIRLWQKQPVAVPTGRGGEATARRAAPDALDALFQRHETGPAKTAEADGGIVVNMLRRQLLDRFLIRSEAFRLYYLRLLDVERQELCTALKGPAFDAMMENLGLTKAPGRDIDARDLEERLRYHEKSFDEFVAEDDWQNNQLFGFLGRLTDEQVTFLANHESPLAACLLLRFLKPTEAAFVLESMAPDRRREILHEAAKIPDTPFSAITEIEQRLRGAVKKMPAHLFGAKQRDVQFWGDVLAQSQDQSSLLDDIRSARPDMYPSLEKYGFRLESIAEMPAETVRRVFSDTDNEILGITVASVPKAVADSILAFLPPKRADMLRSQIGAYRGLAADRTAAARNEVTKRLREAMG